MTSRFHLLWFALVLLLAPSPGRGDVFDLVEHHYADSNGVRIHYVTHGR